MSTVGVGSLAAGGSRTVLGLAGREWAGYLTLAAALAHGIAIPATFREWPEAGWFFVALTLVQGIVGVALLRKVRVAVASVVGIWVNVGTVITYLISRVWGFDFAPDRGPHGTDLGPGRPILPTTIEAVGRFDYFTLFVEVAGVALMLYLLPTRWRTRSTTALMAIGAVLWGSVMWLG